MTSGKGRRVRCRSREARMISRIALAGGMSLALGLAAAVHAAEPTGAAAAGPVAHLSGTLSVTRPDGSARTHPRRSDVNPGDTLATQRDSYAQINFTDGSTMTLRPNTQMRVEDYRFTK